MLLELKRRKKKNEMQVGKYNNTWTTGICPCNTANVRAVQWRVSGWTDGYLWAVLTTYKQIKVIFFKELYVTKFNLPESQACEGVNEIENLGKVLYKMIGFIFFLQNFSQYYNCSCWFDSLIWVLTKWSLLPTTVAPSKPLATRFFCTRAKHPQLVTTAHTGKVRMDQDTYS